MRNVILFFAMLCAACAKNAVPSASTACSDIRITGSLPAEISEASGIAISRRTPGLFWVHNDDGPPVLFGIDSTGAIRTRVRVQGAENIDWEDIAAAPCRGQTCLYIGDIGDNRQGRDDRAIYRIPEPLPSDTVTAPAQRFAFHLPGKSEDVEALFATADDRVFVITKGRSGPITLFEFPQPLDENANARLRPISALSGGLVQLPDMVTGAAASPDNRFIVVRSYTAIQVYTLHGDQLAAVLDAPFPLGALDEPQGEGIDMRDDGTFFLVSERSLSNRAPVSRISCTLPARDR